MPATRAGFIIQLTSVMVPLVAALDGAFAPTRRECLAACAALAGSYLLLLGGPVVEAGDQLQGGLSGADGLLVLAAAAYSVQTVLFSKALRELPAAQLLTRKTAVFAALCGAWLAWDAVTGAGGGGAGAPAPLWPEGGLEDADLWLSILASCLLSGAAAQVAQARVQQVISPQEAQLTYTLTPVFTAAIGALTLGESLSANECQGAALILAAAAYASQGNGGDGGSTGDEDGRREEPGAAAASSGAETPDRARNAAERAATADVRR